MMPLIDLARDPDFIRLTSLVSAPDIETFQEYFKAWEVKSASELWSLLDLAKKTWANTRSTASDADEGWA